MGDLSVEDVSTQADFDRFHRNFRIRRLVRVLAVLAVVGGLGYTFWWGIINRGFIRSEVES